MRILKCRVQLGQPGTELFKFVDPAADRARKMGHTVYDYVLVVKPIIRPVDNNVYPLEG